MMFGMILGRLEIFAVLVLLLEHFGDHKISIQSKILGLPKQPGIYQFKDKNGKIIYIGKAKNLKNRVKSYFQKNLTERQKNNLY